VFKVIELTSSDSSSAGDIERTVLVDPGFSAKVLRTANSAYYGLPRKVASIREAIMFLGLREIRNLALTVGVFELFAGKNDVESLRRRGWWRHSVDTAVASKSIARYARGVQAEEAYTCGLLHWIGKTVLDSFSPAAFPLVAASIGQGATDVEAEKRAYGCDHVEVCLGLCAMWGMPESLIDGLNYVTPLPPGEPGAELRATVAIGTALTRAVERARVSEEEPPVVEDLPAWAVATVGLADEDIETLLLTAETAIAAAKHIM
jgi:HD-like signal output (HDOD) protein